MKIEEAANKLFNEVNYYLRNINFIKFLGVGFESNKLFIYYSAPYFIDMIFGGYIEYEGYKVVYCKLPGEKQVKIDTDIDEINFKMYKVLDDKLYGSLDAIKKLTFD